MEFFAKSLVSWICFANGSMSGASRALTSTLVSKLRALAFATPFSMTYSSCVSAFLNTSWLIACIEIFMRTFLFRFFSETMRPPSLSLVRL